jgi:hypothetical protein
MKKTFLISLFVTSIAVLFAMPTFASGATLRQQVKSLKQRVAALEGRQTGSSTTTNSTARPVGPAGGDLSGDYPNPTIVGNSLGGAEVVDGSLTGTDVQDDSLFGAFDITPNSISANELGAGSVGDDELKNVYSVVSGGVTVYDKSKATTVVNCGGGELIAGGYAWTVDSPGLTVTQNAPSSLGPFANWAVTGRNTSGSDIGLYAWATCLPL